MGESNLTLRISEDLKAMLLAASERSFQTQSDFVLAAITQKINGACPACGRDAGVVVIQSPGMSNAFETWVRSQAPLEYQESQPVSIATQEPSGPRIYTGRFTGGGIHSSYLSLRPEEPGRSVRNPPDFVPIPRAYIVMWEANAAAEALRSRLRNWGYQDVTAMILAPAPQPPRMPRSVGVVRPRTR